MIQIVLPEIDPDSDQPYKRIDHFITEQVQKHLSENTTATKTHNDHLDIRRLLNCYIGNENIPINVLRSIKYSELPLSFMAGRSESKLWRRTICCFIFPDRIRYELHKKPYK